MPIFASNEKIMVKSEIKSILAISCLLLAIPDGTDAQYDYKLATINPFAPVSLFNYASPALVDIDADGDFDLFVGQYASNEMLFYRNTGTRSNPAYTQQTGSDNPLVNYRNNSGCCAPSFVDIDGDGDMDMFSGVWVNIIRYFRNDGNAMNPDFVWVTDAMNPLDQVLTEGICTYPAFMDFDGDMDMDVFITDADGNILFYENTGTRNEPKFTRNEAENPIATAGLSARSKIAFHDVNEDGLTDAVIGHDLSSPELLYFENTGSKQAAKFTKKTGIDNPFRDITGPTSVAPVFADIDNDGDKDLVLGTLQSVRLYEAVQSTDANNPDSDETIIFYPNPTQNKLTISGTEIYHIEILNEQGITLTQSLNQSANSDIDVSDLPKGVYFVKLSSNKRSSIEKLIIY
ncbi:MAG: T9SS type A sorting domain-containing protein [Saprospiraceae bacterium]|nr:T9SS type A sorting domain-containing protein [Saprospiraceae bacterium]